MEHCNTRSGQHPRVGKVGESGGKAAGSGVEGLQPVVTIDSTVSFTRWNVIIDRLPQIAFAYVKATLHAAYSRQPQFRGMLWVCTGIYRYRDLISPFGIVHR